ncbi:Nucleotidylyl transferase [Gloeophyllum trabeum ATCC 11539]|uniref:Nucleotidylyl transferase n=1 Tax=Gloeophyllum trabeum (strain ATCC 11539 / FP-39264 / Madison 617) TaxID=670483 RepID=S7REL0_GLOTA|nr:Nucleotidylyl transferase [Gloeophyllum trabeum ATCC 11539]EPQ52680.1 Nucleotidylyl transferase [Gloeophyllum trabeum ATCC 11539]
MSSHEAALQRVKEGLTPVELIYVSNLEWPFRAGRTSSNILRISVLDSSFNPPTLAHLALLDAAAPDEGEEYDAKLLLLSVRNADKVLKPSDATYGQRLDMMTLLAQEVDANRPPSNRNVAVAIIDEPVFVRKSTILRSFLDKHLSPLDDSSPPKILQVSLVFLMGLDTVTRLLTPSYYSEPMLPTLRRFLSPQPDEDGSRVVCATRSMSSLGISTTDEDVKAKLELGKEFLESGRIAMIDLPEGMERLSSSEVRHKIAQGDNTWEEMVALPVATYIRENELYRHMIG